MNSIQALIHQPTRLRIISSLAGLDEEVEVDFLFLKKSLGLSEGNLSVHLSRLEEAGLIWMKKGFVGKRPKTWLGITPQGRLQLTSYIENLKEILDLS